MTQFTIHQAKTHLSRLIRDVLKGEEVIIAKGEQPLVKLVPLDDARPPRTLDGAKGLFASDSDFFDPLPDIEDYER